MTIAITLIESIGGCRVEAREIDGRYHGSPAVIARGSRSECERAIRAEMAQNPDAIRTGDLTEGARHSGPDADDVGGLVGFGAMD